MSRPTGSVPSRKHVAADRLPATAASSVKSRYCSFGGCGAMTSAQSASSDQQRRRCARPTTAPRLLREGAPELAPARDGRRAWPGIDCAGARRDGRRSWRFSAWRMRGLITPYSMSTIRLTRDDDRRRSAGCRPARPGSRADWIASTSHLPMPGHEKIVSVRIAPASSVPTCRPIDGDDRDQRVAQRVDDDHAPARQRPWRARCARSPRAAPRASTSASCARSPRAGSCRARSSAGSGATAR